MFTLAGILGAVDSHGKGAAVLAGWDSRLKDGGGEGSVAAESVGFGHVP